jgi:predicted unusual protein kinase regulating ubiquinone biosynthesis (AarF/ABC1/UbiB family)
VHGLARGLRMGRAVVEAGAHGLRHRLGVPGADQAAGQALMGGLLELRGAALKIAQFLSLEADLLPESIAGHLSRACHRVPPMGPAFVRDELQRQLGSKAHSFATFDWTPFAAASLGQVHAATLADGTAVAVKIQYPGMPATVRADLRTLRRAVAVWSGHDRYRRALDEIEVRLLEECDYALETEALQWFGEQLAVDGVRVPRVHAALSSSRVLTTQRMHGLHVDQWLATGPAASARNLAAQRLFDVFRQSTRQLGRLHADPNPGNILFGDSAEVTLLDFGCTRRIGADYQDIVDRIFHAAVAGDDEAAHAVYRDMGLFGHCSPQEAWRIDRESLKPFRDWLAIPFLAGQHDFGADQDFVPEGRHRFMNLLRAHALVGIRPEFVLVNRTLYGLYRMFERLGARVRCQWTSATSGGDTEVGSSAPPTRAVNSPARASSSVA